MYKFQCKICGKTFVTKSANRKYCCKKCRQEARRQWYDENDQLCYKCKNATGGCPWSDNFLPVKGWDAEPTVIKDSIIGDIPSFKIKHCPQFIWG